MTGIDMSIQPGDAVECRTADGTWWKTTALTGVRRDHGNGFGNRTWPSVAVGPWGDRSFVNWPAEDVQRLGASAAHGASADHR